MTVEEDHVAKTTVRLHGGVFGNIVVLMFYCEFYLVQSLSREATTRSFLPAPRRQGLLIAIYAFARA